MVNLDQDRVILSSILSMDQGNASRPAENEMLHSTVDSMLDTTFHLASRCAGQLAMEPFVTAYEATATTATMDKECLDKNKIVL